MTMQTGVDRLVRLLQERRTLTLDEAAEELGIEKKTIEEWAEILRDEGAIDLKYGFSHIILTRREKKAAQPVQDRHETFLSKVATAIHQLESETADFESFKMEFHSLKEALGADFLKLQQEFQLVGGYGDTLRKLNEEVEARQSLFEARQKEVSAALKHDTRAYEQIIAALKEEQEKFTAESKQIELLTETVAKQATELAAARERLAQLQQQVQSFQTSVELLQRNQLQPLQRLGKDSAGQLQELKQLHDTLEAAQKPSEERQRITAFAERSEQFEQLIRTIDSEKQKLLGSLRELRKKAHEKGKTAPINDLEETLLKLEERRGLLKQRLGALRATAHPEPVLPLAPPKPEAPLLQVVPQATQVVAEEGTVSCGFSAEFHYHALAALHVHVDITVGTVLQQHKYTLTPDRWDELGIRVLRTHARPRAEGTIDYEVQVGAGMPENWKLFDALHQFDVLTISFTGILTDHGSGELIFESTAETVVKRAL